MVFANGHAGSTIIFAPSTDFIPITLTRVGDDDNAQDGDLDVTAALTITGNGPTNTIIQGGTDATNGVDKIFSFNPLGSFAGFSVSLSEVTLRFGRNPDTFVSNNGEGGAFDFDAGPTGSGSLTVSNCVIQNNSTDDGDGGGIALFDGGDVSITGTTFSGNAVHSGSGASLEGGGVFVGFASGPASFTISNSAITGNTTDNGEGGGLKDFGGAATTYAMHACVVSNNTSNSRGGGLGLNGAWTIDQGSSFTGNTSTGTSGGAGEGGGIYFSGTSATVSNVTITGNTVSLAGSDQRGGGGIAVGSGTFTISDSRIAGNAAASGSGLHKDSNPGTASAVNNWWGCNAGPGNPGCDTAVTSGGTLNVNPWLVLAITASPGVVRLGNTSSLAASLTKNSNNTPGFTVPDGTPVAFGGTLGSSAPPSTTLTSGTAGATFTAGGAPGNGSGTATVDGQTVSALIVVLAPPVIAKSFVPATVAVDADSALTLAITNPNTIAIDANFTDSLPAGLVVSPIPSVTNPCGGSVTAVAGASSVSFSNASLSVGACGISVNVRGTPDGVKSNSVTIDSAVAGTGNTASASLTIVSPPSIAKGFGAATIPINGATSLTFAIASSNVNITLTGVAFADALPAGLIVGTPSNLTSTCSGTATGAAGSGTVGLSGASLAPGASCTISLDVVGNSPGVKNNSVQVTSANAGTGNTSLASITVVSPPTIGKLFGAATIPLNGSTSLTFDLANPNPSPALTGVAFSDSLPAGLVVSTPNGLTGSCGGGTITAAAGSGSVTLSGASLPAGTGCTFGVNVTATTAGSKVNTTDNVTSSEGGAGLTATATLNVMPPDLGIAKAHAGNFTQGQTGAVYTITVSNLTAVPTLGTVTVTDALPSGLTATAFTGPGWTCLSLPALSCSRGDFLAGSGSYPVLTLTVDVASNAAASVLNSATVSGGGELDTGNDTANDPTTIDCGTTTATAGPAQTICTLGTTTPLGGNAPTIGTGAWSVVSGGTGTFSNASDPNATFTHVSGAGPILLRWTISNPPCPDSTADVTVSVTACSAAALAVDAAGNGVFEPGEAVVVSPTWSNTGATPVSLSGTAANFTGPSGPIYTIADASADYGTLAAGASASCASATADCYQLAVSVPPARPVPHWDATFDETLSHGGVKTWVLHIGNTFTDVPSSAPFYRFVENLVHNNVTGGCGPDSYCPADPVTRAQAAVFLVKSRYGAAYVPPPATGTVFNDVPASFFAAAFIEKIAADGVTAGCGGGSYCPNIPLTRAQMAVFLLREKFGASYVPPPATGTVFNDVPASSFAAAYIEQLAALGISSGCGGGNYCPGSSVTRGQVAVFLTTTYTLVLYGP